jgi:geranylgeranyl diphosphate synthase type II
MFYNKYKNEIDIMIQTHLDTFFDKDNKLKDIVKYTLQNGKRIRPSISLDIYNTLTKKNNLQHKLVGLCFLCIEYIHTSSLIIDDLPCMDNAKMRRGNICIHNKYGEAIAQLTSAILLSMATNVFWTDMNNNFLKKKYEYRDISEISLYFIEKFSKILSLSSEGQLLDLQFTNNDIGNLLKNLSEKIHIEEIIYKKTGSFFEMSFELGWILGNLGNLENLENFENLENLENFENFPLHSQEIKELSHNFSMTFQILDDIEDIEEDSYQNKKNINQNYALRYGVEKAINDGKLYLAKFKEKLIELELMSNFFTDMINYFENKFLKN